LEKVTRVAVRFLDDVIDVNSYPLPKIREMTLGNRKIGLGVMGFADLLYMMNIPYVSEQGLQVADKVMGFINKVALDESNKISEEKGVFPNWPKSIYADSIKLRNATVTTIAPTGSISIIAGCSSGVEPLFSLVYERHILDRQVFLEVNPIFKKYLVENFSIDEVNLIMSKVSENGSCQRIDRIPIGKRQVFVTALDIRPEYHVRMQAVFQRNISNAVSKTVNMPNSSTVKDVEDIFMLAYELKCKGITVYRDKSRSIQVLTAGDKKND
jgi:ribonucleoside-diphosphate reductase alpha chain